MKYAPLALRTAGITSALCAFVFFLGFASQHRLSNQSIPLHMTSEQMVASLGNRTIYTDITSLTTKALTLLHLSR